MFEYERETLSDWYDQAKQEALELMDHVEICKDESCTICKQVWSEYRSHQEDLAGRERIYNH